MSEVEVGTNEPEDIAPPPEADVGDTGAPESEGPGSGRSQIRRDLERGFDEARKAAEPAPEKRAVKQPKRGDRVGQRLAAMQDSGTAPEAEAVGEEIAPVSKPPEGWVQEAKAAWNDLPDSVQAAVLKREADMAKGVKAIQAKYAALDSVLEPRAQAIAAYGKTPAEAVHQLFAWFDALGQNPRAAFPALAGSFGYDLRQFVHMPQQQQRPPQQQVRPQGQPGQPGQQQKGVVPQGFNQRLFEQRAAAYLNKQLEQRVAQAIQPFHQQIQAQNQARTDAQVATWAKDKPYYEDVRESMARLIWAGQVPVKNGEPDLDAAYDQACWAIPEVRNRLQQEAAASARAAAKAKKEAEAKAQRDHADKAARASGSLPINAPGVPSVPQKVRTGKGKSVGDSLREAIAAHRGE